jgi:DNA-binding MarR family transcriptional regulator
MTTTTRRRRPNVSGAKFDTNGVRKATIAMLSSAYQSGRFRTLADILIAMEVMDADLDGHPHSMRSLAEKLEIPYTSVSRIVFGLTAEGGEDPGILTLSSHPEDRRRKVIGVDPAAYRLFGKGPHQAAERAMVEYYGKTVRSLKARNGNGRR